MLDSYEGEILYTYDALGQLTSETKNACPECSDCGTTVNITYDNYGNILTKGDHTYSYDNVLWKDRLSSFDGQSITYDAQGNPTNYLGHTLSWEKGRQLKSFDNIQYTYNASGIRTSKTVDNVRHDYVVDGAKILKETWQGNVLIPIYNNDEEVVGIYYNCEPYYFYKNLQNDVIGISDVDGRTIVAYTYDAWGVCTVLHDNSGIGLANINPYRYRSYYYDAEICMYYLQSRYYDPVVGRFVNADETEFIIFAIKPRLHNAFIYCYNNPINKVDTTGYIAIADDAVILGALIVALILMLIAGITSTPQFKSSLSSLCTTIEIELSSTAAIVETSAQNAWNWTRDQLKVASDSLTNYIDFVKADTKIKSKVKKNSKTRFWKADVIITDKYKYAIISTPLTFGTAVTLASAGSSIFAVTKKEARSLTNRFYGVSFPERGRTSNCCNQYWHYHIMGKKFKNQHIFYLY